MNLVYNQIIKSYVLHLIFPLILYNLGNQKRCSDKSFPDNPVRPELNKKKYDLKIYFRFK